MSFIGSSLTLRVFNPDTRSPITEALTFQPVKDFVDIQNLRDFQIAGSVVNVDIAVEETSILISVDQSSGSYSFVGKGGFNGYVFSDLSNTLPAISSVSIDATSTIAITPDRIIYNEDNVFINVGGLRFRRDDTIKLNIDFGAGKEFVPAYVKEIARIYEASLGRQADNSGLNFWVDHFQQGNSLVGIAAHFLGSAEFKGRFGQSLSDPMEFVNQLYLNVLGRKGEAEGVAFWFGALTTGAITKTDMVIGFANSTENVLATAYLDDLGRTGDGNWFVI